jgi:hypothetical protein
MKGIRSLFRLGALAMVAALLVVALTVPATAADQTCDEKNMLAEVDIISVTPLESVFTWEADDLLSYGDGDAGAYPVGQLEVMFSDINTLFNITHYDVIATPSDDPGTSDALGVDEVVTSVNRPREIGSAVTATLDLEPGTNYDIDVIAYFYSVQVSPNQSNQDSLGGTTFLSPPFLGGGIAGDHMTEESPSDQGVHYLVYKADGQLHTFSWLNPAIYGPFDHTWKDPNKKGADILCTNDDGDLEDDCKADDVEGVSHFRVEVTDEDGTTEFSHEVAMSPSAGDTYSYEFNLNDGTYTFAVDAGYVDGGKFYALSDRAQVTFNIPRDYTRYNQTASSGEGDTFRLGELEALINDILETVNGEEDDFDAFYDSDWNFAGLNENKIVVAQRDAVTADPDATPPVVGVTEITEAQAAMRSRQNALAVYLNNLYN